MVQVFQMTMKWLKLDDLFLNIDTNLEISPKNNIND